VVVKVDFHGGKSNIQGVKNQFLRW